MSSQRQPDVYSELVALDFSLALIELNATEADFAAKPWVQSRRPPYPYAVFWRNDNLVHYMYSEYGVDWVKSELRQRLTDDSQYAATVIAQLHKTIQKPWTSAREPRAVALAELSTLADQSRRAWPWLEAMWWLAEVCKEEGHKSDLEKLIELRAEYEPFIPNLDRIIRETIRVTYPDVESYESVLLLNEVLNGDIPSDDVLAQRYAEYLYVDGGLYSGSQKSLEREYHVTLKENVATDSSALGGQSAHAGQAQGTVCIITSVNDLSKMEQGQVLVSSVTIPEYLPAIKKAAAIVTDSGGVLSHAAIVSRELGIPCVIGTGNATRLLKDGDRVKVDADNGFVRKL